MGVDDPSALPPLPPTIWTRDRQKVDTRGEQWLMRASIWGGRKVSINWQRTTNNRYQHMLSQRAWHLTALYIVHRLERQQPRTVEGKFDSVLHFERWLATQVEQGFFQFDQQSFNWSDLTEAVVTEYVWDCDQIGAKGKHFITLRSLYRWGVAQGYQDFDAATLAVLCSIATRSPVSGHIVRSWNPEKGPLTPDEKWLLKQALRQEVGRQEDRILIQILLELGLRPHAMLLLRNQDLKRYEVPGALRYELAVTTIKRQTQERETKGYPITTELGRLLEPPQERQPNAPLLYWLTQAQPDQGIRSALKRFVAEADLISPRTGKRLHLYPYRLRYTLATYLFEMGAPLAAIAAALNHKGTRKIRIYIKTTAALADKMAQAVDPTLAPLVQRFLGQAIIDAIPSGCQNLILSAVPHLQHLQTELGVVGLCQQEQPADCQRAQPLACYLCPSFAALRGGPHQDLLQAIQRFVAQEQGKVAASILKQHDDVQIALQQLLQWLQPAAAVKEAVVIGVKALAGPIDSQQPQLPLAPVLTSPRLSKQKGADPPPSAKSSIARGAS